MKILHFAEVVQGGIASYLLEAVPSQCKALGAENVRVLVAEDEKRFLAGLDPRIIRVLPPRKRDARGLATLFGKVKAIIAEEKPDVLHLHSSFAGAIVRTHYMLKPLRRPKIVYCAHGWSFNMQIGMAKRRAYQFIERLLAKRTDAIVCISEYEYVTALRNGIPKGKLHRIFNGIAAEAPVVDGTSPIDDASRLNLLFIGRQDRQKGYDVLLDAMRRLEGRAIMLHVVGDNVVSKASAAAPQPNVVQHGWQSRDAVASFMLGADALVMPSRWEGFGLVAVEAMRLGLPVCASAVDALPELVKEGVSGHLFPADNSEALAHLLADLDRTSLRRMSAGARQWFLAHFTADRMNRALLDLYADLCPS